MSEPAGRGRSARVWRVSAGIVAGALILGALALGALRFALGRVPENAARIQQWVEQQTQLRLEFTGIDARLRGFGPEVVMSSVRVLDRDGTQALFETREATVGLDVWNFFRTGDLVAGRVRFGGPEVTLVRLADGRIRLLGQRERTTDRPPFDLDRLPAGRLEIDDATVHYRDLKTGRGPWTLQQVGLSLQRARDSVEVAIYKEGGTNTVTVVDRVTEQLDAVRDRLRSTGRRLELWDKQRHEAVEARVVAAGMTDEVLGLSL